MVGYLMARLQAVTHTMVQHPLSITAAVGVLLNREKTYRLYREGATDGTNRWRANYQAASSSVISPMPVVIGA